MILFILIHMKFVHYCRALAISTILLLPISAFSQKLNKPIIDKFANDTTQCTTSERIAAIESFSSPTAAYLSAWTEKFEHQILLNFKVDVTTIDNKYFIIRKGDRALLKLSDNSIIEVVCLKDADVSRQNIKKGFIEREYFEADIIYYISPEDINKLLASQVTAIRIKTDDQVFDYDIKPKNSEVLKKMFKLFINADK